RIRWLRSSLQRSASRWTEGGNQGPPWIDLGQESRGAVMAVDSISRACHTNLVRLYRFCFDNFVKALVYEFMENGSLDLYLLHQNNRTDWGRLRENATGIAKEIIHLHE
ncbi:unnamed protein product, partial [Musa banksii]